MGKAVELWRSDLESVSGKLSETLADPIMYPNLFPDHEWSLKVEQIFKDNRAQGIKASAYPTVSGRVYLDFISIIT